MKKKRESDKGGEEGEEMKGERERFSDSSDRSKVIFKDKLVPSENSRC